VAQTNQFTPVASTTHKLPCGFSEMLAGGSHYFLAVNVSNAACKIHFDVVTSGNFRIDETYSAQPTPTRTTAFTGTVVQADIKAYIMGYD